MTARNEDVHAVARSYIDGVVKMQEGAPPLSEEDYERAVASAEAAFREMSTARRDAAQRHSPVRC
jgi:hypothetical protein